MQSWLHRFGGNKNAWKRNGRIIRKTSVPAKSMDSITSRKDRATLEDRPLRSRRIIVRLNAASRIVPSPTFAMSSPAPLPVSTSKTPMPMQYYGCQLNYRMRRSRDRGQKMNSALPITRSLFNGPQKRLSLLWFRLSPITKSSSGANRRTSSTA